MANIRPFTHRIYVDFSGDDGNPLKTGATKSLCIAWLLSREEDLRHNEGIALGIKKVIGCRPSAELKYKSLRRHASKMKALAMLGQLRAKVVLLAVLKTRIREEEIRNPGTKSLLALLHEIPLDSIRSYLRRTDPGSYFQLVCDEVGYRAFNLEIRRFAGRLEQTAKGPVRTDWLLFAKSGGNLMLQIADVLAGMGREYFESLLGKTKPPCQICKAKHWRPCSYKKNRTQPEGETGLMQVMRPLLLRDERGQAFEAGFIVRPPEVKEHFHFIDCLF